MSNDATTRSTGSDATPPKLSHDELVTAQRHTLDSPRRHYGWLARALFIILDVVYGKRRTLAKFNVLELVARVPYQAWEQAAYVAITHVHGHTDLARRIHARVVQARSQQDNEQWHLLILDELIRKEGETVSRLKYFWLPQLIAFGYYQLSWLLFVIRPGRSYRLNADFEDHAEHEYAHLVAENPRWETQPFESAFSADFGYYASIADVFRQISHDERVHKLESEAQVEAPRFH